MITVSSKFYDAFHGQIITSHNIIWDRDVDPCGWFFFLAPKSAYVLWVTISCHSIFLSTFADGAAHLWLYYRIDPSFRAPDHVRTDVHLHKVPCKNRYLSSMIMVTVDDTLIPSCSYTNPVTGADMEITYWPPFCKICFDYFLEWALQHLGQDFTDGCI